VPRQGNLLGITAVTLPSYLFAFRMVKASFTLYDSGVVSAPIQCYQLQLCGGAAVHCLTARIYGLAPLKIAYCDVSTDIPSAVELTVFACLSRSPQLVSSPAK
jgi:hypothetical protein